MSKRRRDKGGDTTYAGKQNTIKPLKPKNKAQKTYINLIENMTITAGTGYAGTGKSYIAAYLAASMFKDKNSPIERIVICRPNEGVGKSIGFLKGGLNDKMAAWCRPILDVLEQVLGKSTVEYHLQEETGKIELLPLEYARGRSFDNAFVILDEAQNIDWESLKCLLLRLGRDSKLVIDGDVRQCDIGADRSGLTKLLDLMDNYAMPMAHVDFSLDDVVRSDVCKYLLGVFEEAGV